jgi:gas vesicle structural protein
MAVATAQNRYAGGPSPSGLADVLDLILDKGLVIDLYLRVSLVGIELLTVDARIVIASVDTYLRFAEAVGRLNIEDDGTQGLPELMENMTSGAAKSKTSGALDAAKEKLGGLFDDDDDDDGDGDGDRERSGRGSKERVPARRTRTRRKRPSGDDDE